MSDAHGVARDQLRSFIERIERLEEEKKTIADDIKDVYGEAKGSGFDTKILKKVIAIRKMDRDERAEQEAILDTYLAALGMIEQPDFFAGESYDRSTGELSPKLAHTIVTGMHTQAGRAALVAAVDIMIDREEKNTRSDAAPASAAHVTSSNDSANEEVAPGLLANQPETADENDPNEDQREEPSVQATGANAGGDDVDGGAGRAGQSPRTLNTGEGENALPAKRKPAPSMDELRIANALILRPSCKRPGQETCGGQGRTHCRDCITAPAEKLREEA
jgi:uncharacterized protein (UPF0335 family)